MKTLRMFSILLILALLLSSTPTTRHSTQAAEPQVGVTSPARTVEPLNTLNDAELTEQPPFSASSVSSVVQSPGNWHIECVDCRKRFEHMTGRSLRLDDEGHPHIAYGGEHLYYAWHDGTQWHYETVDESLDVGNYASLALDGAGRPHISYCLYDSRNHTCDDLKYAWRDGAIWHIETVDSQGRVGSYTSLALDGAGQPHISYHDWSSEDLKYAWYDGAEWHIETVDSEGWVGSCTSLALDGAGHPHISYYDDTNDDLKYTWHDGVVWHIETVDSKGWVSWHISLALDKSDRPHISYNDWGNDALKYAWHDGATWQIETLDSMDYDGTTSLVLDRAGRPHIGYDDGEKLKYTWHDGIAWQTETLNRIHVWGGCTSLALDGADRPHISYLNDESQLIYTWRDGTTWHMEAVDSSGDVGYDTSMALDGAGRPHISYVQVRPGSALKYAGHDGMAWRIETVDSAGDFGEHNTSLVLDKSSQPHISYTGLCECFSTFWCSCLKYTWHDGMIWHSEIVDSDRGVGFYISTALDRAEHPHISYYDDVDGNLKYAWHDGTAWQIKTVDSESYVGKYNSLALDEMGRPHISYHDFGNGLKYAWHDGTDWQIEMAVYGSCLGFHTSLALDKEDRPHISYNYAYSGLEYAYSSLEYAWYDGTDWHSETVDSEGEVGMYTSLALDESDRPHISYYDYTNDALKHAWHDEMVWYIETVDSGGVGKYNSLALDKEGWPHISYFDSFNNDLKYAYLMPSPLSLDKQATPSDSLHNNDTLTYNLVISGPGLSARLWDPLPANVRYITDSVTLPAVYSPTVNAVVWQGTLPTDTVQVVQFQVAPEITGTGALSAPLPIANTAWLTVTAGMESGKSVSATVSVTVMPDPLFLDKQATPRDGLRNNDTLTYTLTLSGSGQTIHLWDPLPADVYYITDSITSTLTPAAVYSPTVKTVIWEGTLPTDTMQVVRFQVTPGISGTEPLSLSQPIVNTAWLAVTAGVESGRSVSAMVIVNGWHLYLPVVLRRPS